MATCDAPARPRADRPAQHPPLRSQQTRPERAAVLARPGLAALRRLRSRPHHERVLDVRGGARRNCERRPEMGLRGFVFGPRGASLSLDALKTRFAVIADQMASAESLRGQAEAALVQLRAAAARAGLERELQQLENPAPPRPLVREAANVRVRCKESFVTEYQDITLYGGPNDVIDLPDNLAVKLERAGIV